MSGSRASLRDAGTARSGVEERGMGERADRMERRLEMPLLIAALLTIPLVVIQQTDAGRPGTPSPTS